MAVTISGTNGIAVPLGSASAPGVVNTTSATTGIYNPTSTTLGLSTNGTNAVYIDASQNVGIGTSSPLSTVAGRIYLSLKGTGTASNTGLGVLQFQTNAAGSTLPNMGNIEWDLPDNSGSASFRCSYIASSAEGSTANNYGSNLVFATKTDGVSSAGTERMRIDSSGNVGIGTTPNAWSSYTAVQMAGPSMWGTTGLGHISVNTYFDGTNYKYINTDAAMDYYQLSGTHVWRYAGVGTAGTNVTFSEAMRIVSDGRLFLNTATNLPSGTSARFQVAYVKAAEWAMTVRPTDADGGGGGPLIVCNTAGTGIGTITAGSSSISFNTTSDYRLKENVAPMTGGLTAVKALNPVTYKWELDSSDGEGFIAHELQEVVPLAVTGTKDAVDDEGKPIYQGVDYSKIVVHLVAAIKELSAEVEALKAKVGA